MRRLRLYILLFGAALTIPLAYFVLQTHRSVEQEELAELRYFTEALFEEMETELAVLIHNEEARAIEEYTYTYVSLEDPANPAGGEEIRSPLSAPPPEPYILGYMQNNPDGSFQTPLTEGMVALPERLAAIVADLEAVNQVFNEKRSATPEETPAAWEEAARLGRDQADPTVADRYLERDVQEQKLHLGQESRRVQELSEEEYNRALSNMQQMTAASSEVAEPEAQDLEGPSPAPAHDAPPPSVYAEDAEDAGDTGSAAASGMADAMTVAALDENALADQSAVTGSMTAFRGDADDAPARQESAPAPAPTEPESEEPPLAYAGELPAAPGEEAEPASAAPPPSLDNTPPGRRYPPAGNEEHADTAQELAAISPVDEHAEDRFPPVGPQDEPLAISPVETALPTPVEAESLNNSLAPQDLRERDAAAAGGSAEADKSVGSGDAATPVQSEQIHSDTFQVEVDPMQSVIIDPEHIFIFRRIVIGNQIYRQGFVLKVNEFLAHLAQNHFSGQPMAEFANLRLAVRDDGRDAAVLDAGAEAEGNDFRLTRVFPRPFSFLQATLCCDQVPRSPARSTLTTMTIVLMAVTLLGLFAIHQSARVVEDHSQRRQGFVSSVTHELKTPLTNIRMYVEMLEHGMARDTEREQEYLRIVSSESSRLSRLINNVLEFSRLENRSRSLDLRQGDMSEVFQEVEEVMRDKMRQEGFTLKIERNDAPPFPYNPEAMTQVLLNLVENSLKFGKNCPEKTVTLRLRPNESHMLVQVSDTGPGIPAYALPKIFDDFYRVDNSLTRTTRGTGIGLALVRKLAAAMHGAVRAENNPGPGCTITISLPA